MSDLLLVAATDRELFPGPGARTLCCGIGPVEAALVTAHALWRAEYVAVLHVGIAGATDLSPGTFVIGSEAIYCDVLDPSATLPRVHRVAPAPELVEATREALPEVVAPIATSARVGGGILCPVEAMEGFGVLRAAMMARVPAVELRVISNSVSDADRARWQIADALAALADVVPRLVPRLLSTNAQAGRPWKREDGTHA